MKKLSFILIIIFLWFGISYFLYQTIKISYILLAQSDCNFSYYKLINLLTKTSFSFGVLLLLWKYSYLIPKIYRFMYLSLITGIFIIILFYLFMFFFAPIFSLIPVLIYADENINDAFKNIMISISMLIPTISIGILSLMIGATFATLSSLIIDKILMRINSSQKNI